MELHDRRLQFAFERARGPPPHGVKQRGSVDAGGRLQRGPAAGRFQVPGRLSFGHASVPERERPLTPMALTTIMDARIEQWIIPPARPGMVPAASGMSVREVGLATPMEPRVPGISSRSAILNPARKAPSPEAAAMNARLFRAIAAAKPRQSDRRIAAELGFSHGVLGNVRTGANGTFSLDNWRRLAGKFPGVATDFATLNPDKPGRRVKRPYLPPDGPIKVKAEVAAGLMRPSFYLADDRQVAITLPVGEADLARGAFGVVVRRPGAEELYAEGSILVCIPIAAIQPGELADGRRVIVQRIAGEGIEATVRQVKIEANEASLWWRSTHLDYQAPVKLSRFRQGQPLMPWSVDDSRYRIIALVIWRGGEDAWPPRFGQLG